MTKIGFKTVDEFRRNGFVELGKDVYGDLYRELAKFEVGIQFLCYGHDKWGIPHIFEIESPGKINDYDIIKYAVIGSGYFMATASLRRRHMSMELKPTIYRLLEAKFCAETATGVGKATNVLAFKKNGSYEAMRASATDKLRKIWQKTLVPEAPDAAIKLISSTRAVKMLEANEDPAEGEQSSEIVPQTSQGLHLLPDRKRSE